MGRGRAKAKQTKVARQLKYSSSELDVDALYGRTWWRGPRMPTCVEDDPYDPYTAAYGDAESGR